MMDEFATKFKKFPWVFLRLGGGDEILERAYLLHPSVMSSTEDPFVCCIMGP